ncbi:6-phosphogluconate dehydrogenase (decarboxylating) [Fonsecaea monophora]|uniref:6-phosphogluconate dehydrogenase, decarboxylating n=1 Tax=Fonsecaea monophora TaxID=254056 RepID=A0A177FHH9_9EURO|nr:6-phosphogluconate dehydrogenase (decarboxylating) [Fonsecaea monophora]KAH0844728.1 6-phosphogluconate dehydrogenase, decarboxylating [Fonsecaea pedrosoi]OAG43725.1 6-phosphogluconate dehydrogenase (decarboxylating) [Fonsecaea monophora]
MGQQDRPEFEKLGMIGVGSMGGMMSLLYAEHGVEVHYYDPNEENVKQLQEHAEAIQARDRIVHQKDYKELCESISSPGSPKLFVFSIPHGSVGDETVENLRPYLKAGDIILDCSNEDWRNTERRQKALDHDGIHYIGCGVSGGYQSARHGPSMSPGGDAETLKKIVPFLERVAAKDKQGRPCTTGIGPAGSGHYVKMVHNGIEQGMMSAIAEVWFILNRCLKMSYEEIADTFESWNGSEPLRDNFLVAIGADINRTRDEEGSFVLANVLDKVVQDVDNSEGTGVWTCEETIRLHVPSPTIVSAHLFRLASADAAKRERVNRAFGGGTSQPATIQLEVPHEKALPSFIEDLKLSLYAAFLCAFLQGLSIIKAKDREQGWNLDYRAILQIWRGGCIIQSDHISDLLDRVLSQSETLNGDDLLAHATVAAELGTCVASLKNVVLKSLAADASIPALSATLEYIKYSSSTELPTQFMEAELDYFGAHSFDLKSEGPGRPLKGSHHYEWKPPRGIFGDKLDGTR